ncbi:MAG: apolipoprotein N-acyltransferase, partial [Actinomycetota bacterium]
QWDIERLRALNTGSAVVVASTSGISGFIAPDGTVQRQLGEGETGYLVSEVPLSTGRTPASLLGATPEIAAGVAMLIGVGLAIYVRRRRAGS